MRYHRSANGEPAECNADVRNCPRGADAPHFDTPEEVTAHYEREQEGSLFAPQVQDASAMKMSDLNREVKTSSDPAVFAEAIKRGSGRTHRNLLKNENVDAHTLKKLRDETDDAETKKLALTHPNYSGANMTDEEFVAVAGNARAAMARKTSLYSDDSVTDERLARVVEKSKYDSRAAMAAALENPNNKLSQEAVHRYANEGWGMLEAAQRSGRLDPSRIKDMSKRSVYWGSVDKAKDPAVLNGYSEWAQKNAAEDDGNIARRVASNPHSPTEAVDRVAHQAPVEAYSHKNTSPRMREELKAKHPEVQRAARIADIEREHGPLRDQLVVSHDVQRPYNGAPYSSTTIQLDKEKVEKYKLTRDEINDIFVARGYNGGSSYDPKTGVFRGSIDSSG